MESERNEIVRKIKIWLKEIGTPFKDIPDPKGKDIYIKVDNRPDDKERLSYFIEFLHNQDHFWISIHLPFTNSDLQSFKLSKGAFVKQIMIMLKMPVLLLNVGYDFRPSPQEFEFLEIKKLIYFDGFSKNIFFDVVDSVIHAYEFSLIRFEEFKESLRRRQKGSFSPQ